MSRIEDSQAGINVKFSATGKSRFVEGGKMDKSSEADREEYSLELEWAKTRPPSDEQLVGEMTSR